VRPEQPVRGKAAIRAMNAITITGIGGPEVLLLREVPTPAPAGDQVRVRVRACGLNRADLLQCRGFYPAPAGAPADIPGLEFSGEIDALGPDVVGPLKIGDRVMGIVAGGGLAEYVVLHERMAVLIPPNLEFVAAAAVPEAFITAHDALLFQARLVPGEDVLVHAVGSGVGTAAVQLAHAMSCRVFGTSRTSEKLERARDLGLDRGINTARDDFVEVVRGLTDGRGVDVIIDLIGAAALAGNQLAIAVKGRVVLVGLLGGHSSTLDLNQMLRKRATLIGTTLRARPIEEKILTTRRFADQVVPWLARGLVRPIVDSTFPFDQVREALARLESNQVFGKIVLAH
jgi:NADPH:quinone reductase